MSRPMPSHCAGEFLQNSVSNSLPASISPLDRRKLSSGAETTMSRASYKSLKTPKVNLNRKLEMEFNKALASAERRRQKSGNDYKTISSSSSAASSDAENDSHIDLVLTRSRDHLENIQALKKRRDFLRPEDYVSFTPFPSWNRVPIVHPFSILAFCAGRNYCHVSRQSPVFGNGFAWTGWYCAIAASPSTHSRWVQFLSNRRMQPISTHNRRYRIRFGEFNVPFARSSIDQHARWCAARADAENCCRFIANDQT